MKIRRPNRTNHCYRLAPPPFFFLSFLLLHLSLFSLFLSVCLSFPHHQHNRHHAPRLAPVQASSICLSVPYFSIISKRHVFLLICCRQGTFRPAYLVSRFLRCPGPSLLPVFQFTLHPQQFEILDPLIHRLVRRLGCWFFLLL